MRTRIIITSDDVEKLKQKARALKKENGIAHGEALDRVAQSAGFNHWHHVSESVKIIKPVEQAYFFGVIIAMDVKDAMDFRDPSRRFVEDDLAFALCADDIYRLIWETDEGKSSEGDPLFEEDKKEWMSEGLMDYTFFRFTSAQTPSTVNDVVAIVRECSFWPPQFIWHKGIFQERPSDIALDDDGNIAGIRFSF